MFKIDSNVLVAVTTDNFREILAIKRIESIDEDTVDFVHVPEGTIVTRLASDEVALASLGSSIETVADTLRTMIGTNTFDYIIEYSHIEFIYMDGREVTPSTPYLYIDDNYELRHVTNDNLIPPELANMRVFCDDAKQYTWDYICVNDRFYLFTISGDLIHTIPLVSSQPVPVEAFTVSAQ